MNLAHRLCTAITLVALPALLWGGAGSSGLARAQTGAASAQVQELALPPSALLAIDQHRATVVNRILFDWSAALVQSGAGLDEAQLRALLSGLRADHLLAASLAGSLEGLRNVIALALMQAESPPVAAGLLHTKALGDANDDLVYTPVTPCRLGDTRVVGGHILPNTTRDFKVWVSSGGFTAQGGSSSNCNVPANPPAVVLNLTAVNPAGGGWLVAYPTGGAYPSSSVLNYQSGIAALANGAILPACVPNCANQLSVNANQSAVDVVIDIVGYFKAPGAPIGTISNIATGTGLTGGPITSTGTISVAAGGITATQLANNAVTQGKLSPLSGAAAGKVLGTDGTNLQWQTAAGGGTVTGVTASAPLASSGGAAPNISLTGSIPVANGGTGQTTLTTNGIVYGQATAGVGVTGAGTAGQVLAGTAGAPAWTGSPSLSGNLTVAGITALGGPGGVYGFLVPGGAPAPGPYSSLGFNSYGPTNLAGVAGHGGVLQFQDGDGSFILYSSFSSVAAGAAHSLTPRLTIRQDGYVGIGTVTPSTGRLHVEHSVNAIFGHSTGGIGVYGTSALFEGVRGEASEVNHGGVAGIHSGAGNGVFGQSASGIGVLGTSTSFEGVRGQASDVNHGAVVGIHSGAGIGVFGTSTGAGVQGTSVGRGVVGTSTTGTGVYGTTAGAGLAAPAVYGVNTNAGGGVGMFGEANGSGAVGMFGASSNPAGYGIYARNSGGGIALYSEGNTTQARAKGGFVKALVEVGNVLSNGVWIPAILRCYNGQTGASTGNCGFAVTNPSQLPGIYRINFGFQISDRFYSVSSLYANCCSNNNTGANYRVYDANNLEVFTFVSGSANTSLGEFMAVVF